MFHSAVFRRFLNFRVLVVLWASCLSQVSGAAGDMPVGDVQFQSTMEINAKVEDFANGLASALLNDFDVTNVELARDERGQVINRFHSGELAGSFVGVLQSPSGPSQLDSEFSIEMGVEQEKKIEYEIHVRAKGQISNPKAFLVNYLNQVDVECRRRRQKVSAFNREQLCDSLKQNANWRDQSPVAMGRVAGEALKQGLLDQVADLSFPIVRLKLNSQLNAIRTDLIEYLDEQIQVTGGEDRTTIDVDLSGLSSLFSPEATDFLNYYELRDYHYKSIQVSITDDKVTFNYFMVKLHVQSVFDAYMAALGSIQETLEDPDKGRTIGKDIRYGQGIKGALLGNSGWFEFIGAGSAYFSSGDQEPISDEEAEELDDLGID